MSEIDSRVATPGMPLEFGSDGAIHGMAPIPGYNVDPIDVPAGLAALTACGYREPHTVEVVAYALQRWARGEEAAAERAAIDLSFHGIDFTSWRRVLAAAVAKGTQKLEEENQDATG